VWIISAYGLHECDRNPNSTSEVKKCDSDRKSVNSKTGINAGRGTVVRKYYSVMMIIRYTITIEFNYFHTKHMRKNPMLTINLYPEVDVLYTSGIFTHYTKEIEHLLHFRTFLQIHSPHQLPPAVDSFESKIDTTYVYKVCSR
jgi:hypothetical protein